jgi:glycosyltransferase involved in cell wall biosynthesis
VDAFCALSQFSADKHREFGFSVPMTVLPSFLPARPTAAGDDGPVEPVQPAARGYFLFVGRLEKIKGLQDVIPCFEGTQGSELWVVGEGSYEAELRRLAESSSRVRFLGVRTQEQLRDLYANAIAVVTPSICYEVFPMVVLEAFREATPIVARNLGPYPEIVEQSGGGMLFESVAELRAALNLLASDGELRDQYGNAGLKAFQAFWHEEPALERYFALIKNIAQRRGMTELLRRMEA